MRLLSLALPLLLAACVSVEIERETVLDHGGHGGHGAPVAAAAAPPKLSVPVLGRDGARIGEARFSEGPAGVLIQVSLDAGALPEGWHGMHLHQVGDCSDFAAGFTASGAHLGKREGTAHGLLHPQGPETGDLPSLYAPAPPAPIAAEAFSSFVTVEGAAPSRDRLRDADGAALIIHANIDDQITQPIGGAGARLACAALPPG